MQCWISITNSTEKKSRTHRQKDGWGGLELEHYQALDDLWSIAQSQQVGMGFFEDTHIDHQGVRRLMAILGSLKEIDKTEMRFQAYRRLKIGLQCALDKGAGIISICD